VIITGIRPVWLIRDTLTESAALLQEEMRLVSCCSGGSLNTHLWLWSAATFPINLRQEGTEKKKAKPPSSLTDHYLVRNRGCLQLWTSSSSQAATYPSP
jgi:hypothetical protein